MRPGTLLRWRALSPLLKREIAGNSKVLDVGGFDGNVSHLLLKARPGLEICIVDLDEKGLALARKNGLQAVCGSALGLPFISGKFDVVLCLDLLEHLDQPGQALREIHQILKENGKLILTTPYENGVHFPFLSRRRNVEINIGWGHSRLGFSLSELIEMLHVNGFSLIAHSAYFNILSRLAYRIGILSIFRRVRAWILFDLATRFEPYLPGGGHEHIILAVKDRQINEKIKGKFCRK
jgi:SAM-dependent methyltransferase